MLGCPNIKQSCKMLIPLFTLLETLFSVFVLVTQGTPDKSINITIASASLQSFTEQQWRTNQQDITNTASTGIT